MMKFDCEIFGIKNIDTNFCVNNKILRGKKSFCFKCDKASGVSLLFTKQQNVSRNNKGKRNNKGNNLYKTHHIVDISRVRAPGTKG